MRNTDVTIENNYKWTEIITMRVFLPVEMFKVMKKDIYTAKIYKKLFFGKAKNAQVTPLKFCMSVVWFNK